MSESKYETIKVDESLILEQLKIEDADDLFALTEKDRAYLSEYLPWPEKTKSVDDSKEFIKLMIQRRADNQEYGYGIKYDNNVIGHISLMHVNDEKRPEIGYWVASEFSGKGITTKATAALTSFALSKLGIPRIIIRAEPENTGSNRVAEKAGYIFQGKEDDNGKFFNVWSITPESKLVGRSD